MRVADQGEGFEPEEVADPLAPENILKSSGRGIFFMRSFMDDVQLQRAPEGGMEVRMVKKLARRWLTRSRRSSSPPPIQAVINAGAMQLAGFGHLHIEKKGAIDLVTRDRSRRRARCSAR